MYVFLTRMYPCGHAYEEGSLGIKYVTTAVKHVQPGISMDLLTLSQHIHNIFHNDETCRSKHRCHFGMFG